MSSTHGPTQDGKDWVRIGEDSRHTKEDAISERQFERLVESTYRMDDDYFARECRFVLFAAGRLGLRAGEIAHMKSDWIDWDAERIVIPTYENCTDGRNGGICGHCKGAARQMAQTRTKNALESHYSSIGGGDPLEPGETVSDLVVQPERFYGQLWSPKTESAHREIPYSKASTRAAIAVEEYFSHYDEFMASRGIVNRRVDRMVENSRCGLEVGDLYPHALRGTAASYFAARGLSAMDLKAMFGWSEFSTAIAYIEESPERLEDSLQQLRH